MNFAQASNFYVFFERLGLQLGTILRPKNFPKFNNSFPRRPQKRPRGAFGAKKTPEGAQTPSGPRCSKDCWSIFAGFGMHFGGILGGQDKILLLCSHLKDAAVSTKRTLLTSYLARRQRWENFFGENSLWECSTDMIATESFHACSARK